MFICTIVTPISGHSLSRDSPSRLLVYILAQPQQIVSYTAESGHGLVHNMYKLASPVGIFPQRKTPHRPASKKKKELPRSRSKT